MIEITLRGRVLPVGAMGKVIAEYRRNQPRYSAIKEQVDIDEVPKKYGRR